MSLGGDCSSLPPEHQEDCKKKKAKDEIKTAEVEQVGGDCSSLPPEHQEDCKKDKAKDEIKTAEVERVPTSPPPETFGAYKKQGAANGGVMAMMAELEAELDKDIQESTVDEEHAQAEYEEYIADSAAKRANDVKSLAHKVDAKAATEVEMQKMTQNEKDA